MNSPEVRYTRVQWHNSLIMRVIALCVVLVLCLLGAVYVLTGHYYQQVSREMEERAAEIVHNAEVLVEAGSEELIDRNQLSENLEEPYDDVDISITPIGSPDGFSSTGGGGYVFVTTHRIEVDDQEFQLTARFTLDPLAEIGRAFRNRYLAALSLGFLVALGLMVYLIARALRPLRELSESCARISEGDLSDVTIGNNAGEVLVLEETFNRMVGSLRDKDTVEANLRQAQRLSAIGNLAAGVAHDVRNPLNAIKLLSGHAIDTLEDTPEQAGAIKQIRTIRDEVNRLEEIVSGFLSLAKEEELRRESVAIDPLLAECVNLVKKDAEDRDVRLASDLRAGNTALLIDPKHWTRAVLNVLINALEACSAGGRVRLFSRVTDRACAIEIRDDGPGIPKATLDRVFDAYYTTKTSGTGLGLSITRGIVEEHGGTIAISSTEGEGCQVLLTLPLTEATPTEQV